MRRAGVRERGNGLLWGRDSLPPVAAVKKILLIHAGDVVLNALGLVLEQEGYAVEAADLPAEMQSRHADLVLLDAELVPGGHGTIADLKLELGVSAPVYLFASGGEEALRSGAEKTGAEGYICTEWGFRRIVSVVRWAVRNRTRQVQSPQRDLLLGTLNRILVLDDHEGARRRLVTELRNQGYAVEGCGSMAELEDLYSRLDPDVVVTDVILPDVTGDEICRQLKSRMQGRLTPIILISSLPEWELKQRAERAGADAYCRKQDGLPKLVQVLEELLSEIVF